MDLILWRHADALPGSPDLERPLSRAGYRQAHGMAAWLRRVLPDETRILVSPALRALQTVTALGRAYEVVQALAPGAQASRLLQVAGWPGAAGAVLIVGHQPTLGAACGRLLCGGEQGLTLRKGGVIWLARRMREGGAQVVLKALMTPELLPAEVQPTGPEPTRCPAVPPRSGPGGGPR